MSSKDTDPQPGYIYVLVSDRNRRLVRDALHMADVPYEYLSGVSSFKIQKSSQFAADMAIWSLQESPLTSGQDKVD